MKNLRHRIDPKLATVVVVVLLAGLVTLVRARTNSGPAFQIGADSSTSPAPFASQRSLARGDAAARDGNRTVVYVAGAVVHPGVYAFAQGARVEDALRRASGPSATADLLAINLAHPLADGDMVLVPRKGDVEEAARAVALDEGPAPVDDVSATPPRTHRARKHRKRKHGKRARHRASSDAIVESPGSIEPSDPAMPTLDINRASRDDLETLPGIGAELADRIVTFRDLNGPFASTDELLDVEGVTQSKLARLEALISVR